MKNFTDWNIDNLVVLNGKREPVGLVDSQDLPKTQDYVAAQATAAWGMGHLWLVINSLSDLIDTLFLLDHLHWINSHKPQPCQSSQPGQRIPENSHLLSLLE